MKTIKRRTFDCTCGEQFPTDRKRENHCKKTGHERVSDLALLAEAILGFRRNVEND